MISPSVWTGILCPMLFYWLTLWVPFGSKKILNSSKLAVVFELSFKPPSGNISIYPPANLYSGASYFLFLLWLRDDRRRHQSARLCLKHKQEMWRTFRYYNDKMYVGVSACDTQLPVPVRADSTSAGTAGTGRGAVCRGDFLSISCPPSFCKVAALQLQGKREEVITTAAAVVVTMEMVWIWCSCFSECCVYKKSSSVSMVNTHRSLELGWEHLQPHHCTLVNCIQTTARTK